MILFCYGDESDRSRRKPPPEVFHARTEAAEGPPRCARTIWGVPGSHPALRIKKRGGLIGYRNRRLCASGVQRPHYTESKDFVPIFGRCLTPMC